MPKVARLHFKLLGQSFPAAHRSHRSESGEKSAGRNAEKRGKAQRKIK